MTDRAELREKVAIGDITAEQVREIFAYDPETGVVTYKKRTAIRIKLGMVAGSQNKHGYLTVKVSSRNVILHRVIWLIMTGAWPKGMIDHIDRNRTNNAWNNLRVVDSAQNSWNAKKPNHVKSNTGIPGVKKKDNRYLVDISVRRRKVYVGCFKTLEEAAKARKAAVEKYHGEYAIRALIPSAAAGQSQSDGSGNTHR